MDFIQILKDVEALLSAVVVVSVCDFHLRTDVHLDSSAGYETRQRPHFKSLNLYLTWSKRRTSRSDSIPFTLPMKQLGLGSHVGRLMPRSFINVSGNIRK